MGEGEDFPGLDQDRFSLNGFWLCRGPLQLVSPDDPSAGRYPLALPNRLVHVVWDDPGFIGSLGPNIGASRLCPVCFHLQAGRKS